uniref:C3H1-type domain-containing protein n=1 Tax=Neobodo designis TaxID=312471 RepID=A0A7S1MBP3_NEODS|mmetsp:Transcript_37716/g.116537  ORF Transcript_37716/g.116537 Transcript_37716/m.116537 type:complete len:420 (+) Transcript_37716:218-1477(+)
MDVATTCAVAAQPCGTLLPDGLFSEALGNERGAGFDFTLPKAESSSDSTGLIDSSGSNSDSGAAPSATSGSSGFKAPPVRPKAPQPNVTAPVLETLLAASPDAMCPAGATIGVYNSDMTQHYAIPSEHVQITRGAIKYVDHHARYGAQTRFRFQLCHNFLLRKCPKLSECSYIHATQLPAPTQVHLNPFAPRRLAADRHGRSNEVAASAQDDPSVTNAYARMPAGGTLEVHPPQGNQVSAEVTRVPTEQIFVTVGATEAMERLAAAAGDASKLEGPLPRHCTKFQYRRACPQGPSCRAIHSAVPFAGTALSALHQTAPSRRTGDSQEQQAAPRPTAASGPHPQPAATQAPLAVPLAPPSYAYPPAMPFQHPGVAMPAPSGAPQVVYLAPNAAFAQPQLFAQPTYVLAAPSAPVWTAPQL